MALETFEGVKTGWEGLWYNPDLHQYNSYAFNISELKKFKGKIRLLVRKNKFYSKDTQRPNFQFCICDSKADKAQSFKFLKAVSDAFDEERFIKVDDAINICRDALLDMQYGYSYDDLSIECANKMLDNSCTSIDIFNEFNSYEEHVFSEN